MDKRIMELRIKQWITIIEEQGKSGLNKAEWCTLHGVDRTTFFRWQKRVRAYLLNQWEDQPPLIPSSAQTDETGFVEFPLWKWQDRQTSVPGNKQPVPVLLP